MQSVRTENRVRDRIKLAIQEDFPSEIHIEPCNHCNKSCFMCPTRNRYSENLFPLGYMDLDLYKRIIDECHVHHGSDMVVNLHKDGEPLMHAQIGDMIKYATDREMFVHFTTNGLLLNEKRQEIVESNLSLLTVSVIDESAQDRVREFMAYRKAVGAEKPFVQVKLFTEEHVTEGYAPPEDHPVHAWRDIVDKVYLFTGWHNWTDAQARTSLEPCSKIAYSCTVTWEGLVTLCCLDYRRDRVLGCLTDGQSLKEVWEEIKKVGREMGEGRWRLPCTRCDYHQRMDEDESKCLTWAKDNYLSEGRG